VSGPAPAELAHLAEEAVITLARQEFGAFIEYVGKDRRGHPIEQHELHELLWEVAEEAWDLGLFLCAMIPMGHGKTTQCCYRAAFEIGRDHNLIGCIVTDNDPNAVMRQELVREIMATEEYRRVFPGVKMVDGKDSKGAFTIQRTGHSKDATLDSLGVMSGVGARASLLMLDDVITLRNALFMPAERRKVYDAIRSTWSSRPMLGEEDEPNRIIWIQTAYHDDDAAARLRRDPDSGWVFLIVRAEAPYEDLLVEVWMKGKLRRSARIPGFHSANELQVMAGRMGPTHAGRGLGNRALSGEEQPFKEEMFGAPPPLPLLKYRRRVMVVDPAGDATKTRTADTDYCANALIGLRADGVWEVVRCERVRGSPSVQAEFSARNAKEWRPTEFHLEAVDMTFPTVMGQALRRLKVPIKVREFKPTQNKIYRIIEILEPPLSSGELVCDGETFGALRSEALSFPVGAHDDMVDAVASAYRIATSTGPSKIRATTERPTFLQEQARKVPQIRRAKLWDGE